MRFGINQLFTMRPGRDARDLYREALEQAVLAEELGFTSVWLAEHHFTTYGVMPSLATFGAAVAARTSRIKIGTAILVLPLGHPVRLAEEMAMLDVLSNGRLELGVGRGYQPAEFRGLGIDQSEARERFEECLAIMRLAWRDEPLNFVGKHYRFEDVDVLPKPVQRPGPLVRIAAVSSDTFRALGARGEATMLSPNFSPLEHVKRNLASYAEAATAAGHDVAALGPPPMVQQVFVDPDDGVAKRDPEAFSMSFYGRFASLLPGSDGRPVDDDYRNYEKIRDAVTSVSYDTVLRDGVAFGDPPAVIERMALLERELGTEEMICWFNFGDLPHERVVRNMRLFAEEVMPAFAPMGTRA